MKQDCFACFLESTCGDQLSVYASSMAHKGVTGRVWTGQEYDPECCIAMRSLPAFKLTFERFYGLHTFHYASALQLLLSELIFRPFWLRLFDKINQALFNARTPLRHDRTKLLEAILAYTIDRRTERNYTPIDQEGISVLSIMELLYGKRIYGHQAYKRLQVETELALNSLVDSGDLEKNDTAYSLRDQALNTLTKYEMENRRQRTTETRAWLMIILTLMIALGTAIQAYVAFAGK